MINRKYETRSPEG